MANAGSGKVVVVTGASSGIGQATALRLARGGWTVWGAARRADRLEALGNGILPLPLDLTDDASMVAAVDRVVAESGRIDALVNNAGYGSYGAIEDVPMEDARRQLEVNVVALGRMCQLVLPVMRAQGSGRIVNITSMGGRAAFPFGGWYHATKFAVEGLSDALRQEVAPFGIDVVIIEPGGIKTEWGGIAAETGVAASSGGVYGDRMKQVAAVLEDGRMQSSPDVVAKAIEKGLTARRPRTRYAIGMGAKPVVYGSTLLPDRVFDGIARQVFR